MGEEEAETGLRSRGAGAERDLGSRLMEERHRVQGRAVEAGGSVCLCGQDIQDQKISGRIGSKKSGLGQSKGDVWGGSRDTAGDG